MKQRTTICLIATGGTIAGLMLPPQPAHTASSHPGHYESGACPPQNCWQV
ncbi:MAG: hypothetical protein HC848_03210 [Limnobacter sp.]|nr:hypothetical protein [Limnobacter sp.]